MRKLPAFAIFVCFVSGAYAQLTPSQKQTDFLNLAALYDKNYAPYEWKRDVVGFDLLNLKPWLDQVTASKDDLSFYDICVRYVASLQDSHDELIIPADFEAFLPLFVDIYDGKVLIDGISRADLPSRTYPFQVGDELVSVDGTSMADWIKNLAPYTVNGSANVVSRQRLAAAMAIDRYQGWYTFANKIGDTATVQIRRQNGNLESYTIAWQTFGTPLTSEGPVPSPRTSTAVSEGTRARGGDGLAVSMRRQRHLERKTSWDIWNGPPQPGEVKILPDYMAPMHRLTQMGPRRPAHAVQGSIFPFEAPDPVFDPPAGFRIRLGSRATDLFLSGTFPVGKFNIGFIRIPTFDPSSETTALSQFLSEITFFQANTDGLVIDLMANGGGDLCYSFTLASLLTPANHSTLGAQLRATQTWVLDFSAALVNAQLTGAPQWLIDTYTAYLKELQQTLAENRGLTGPLPLCGTSFNDVPPARDSRGNNLAYTKPVVLLTDNYTLSAAESFSAVLQDAGRATVYGTRTDGGGGVVVEFNATNYSEANARVTLSLMTRAKPILTPGFPATQYLENVGVYPDVAADYMTVDNLMNGGAKFVTGFSNVISNLITAGHP